MATPKPTTPKSGVPKPDILKPGIPRYRAVAAALDQAIASGEHAVGTTLPPEKTLCETFGVSRHTIRDAIRLIERDGLVSRLDQDEIEYDPRVVPASGVRQIFFKINHDVMIEVDFDPVG